MLSFFGSYFRKTLLMILLAELLSFFVYWMRIVTDLNSIFFLIAVGLTLGLSLYKLRWGIYIALVELFIGSKGYLLALSIGEYTVSIRVGIFCAVMLAWLAWLIRKKLYRETWRNIKNQKALLVLGTFCLWGLFFAVIQGLTLKNIFLDFNAWLYFLYFLPFVAVLSDQEEISRIMQIFTACVTALAMKSLVFLFVFSHRLGVMRDFYKWGRDSGWGEFTLLKADFYRIFSQAHIFVIIGFFVLLGFLFFKGSKQYVVSSNKYLFIVLGGSLAVIFLSLSRSFWLGVAAGLLLAFSFAIYKYRLLWREWAEALLRLFVLAGLSIVILIITVAVPIPGLTTANLSGDMLKERLELAGAGVSSRWSQLPQLTTAIAKHPIIGSGWGTTITYHSQDPRILTANNPSGIYTTFAFEWGYLDIILKIGLAGLVAYLYFIYRLVKRLIIAYQDTSDRPERALIIGLLLGLAALVVIHGFSPYLNHPLGIGYLLMMLIFSNIFRTNNLLSKQ